MEGKGASVRGTAVIALFLYRLEGASKSSSAFFDGF